VGVRRFRWLRRAQRVVGSVHIVAGLLRQWPLIANHLISVQRCLGVALTVVIVLAVVVVESMAVAVVTVTIVETVVVSNVLRRVVESRFQKLIRPAGVPVGVTGEGGCES
jgi:hypothetical protein